MVKDIFAIQAAGVGVEREFSIASAFNTNNKAYTAPVLCALMVSNHEQTIDAKNTLWDYYSIHSRENVVNDMEVEAEREDFQTTLKGFVASLTNLNDISDGEDEPDLDDAPLPDAPPPASVDVLEIGIELDVEGLLSTALQLVEGPQDRVGGRGKFRRKPKAPRGKGKGKRTTRGTATPSLAREGNSSIRAMLPVQENDDEDDDNRSPSKRQRVYRSTEN